MKKITHQLVAKEIGFWKSYKNSEKYFIYEVEKLPDILVAKYILDSYSSIWMYQEESYRTFAQKFKVISGGWYGNEKGGRWRTFKRTFGELTFAGVSEMKECIELRKVGYSINKSILTNKFKIDFSGKEVGAKQFKCDNIVIDSSDKILLLNNEKNVYEDMTDSLTDDGMRLLE